MWIVILSHLIFSHSIILQADNCILRISRDSWMMNRNDSILFCIKISVVQPCSAKKSTKKARGIFHSGLRRTFIIQMILILLRSICACKHKREPLCVVSHCVRSVRIAQESVTRLYISGHKVPPIGLFLEKFDILHSVAVSKHWLSKTELHFVL